MAYAGAGMAYAGADMAYAGADIVIAGAGAITDTTSVGYGAPYSVTSDTVAGALCRTLGIVTVTAVWPPDTVSALGTTTTFSTVCVIGTSTVLSTT
eukprot:2309043-Amphidinium_carterae.1